MTTVFPCLCHTDAIDNGQNKKAIQIADKIIKKQVDLHCAKVRGKGEGREGGTGRQIDEWTVRSRDRWREGRKEHGREGQTDIHTDRGMDRRMEEWINGGREGERDRRTDRLRNG